MKSSTSGVYSHVRVFEYVMVFSWDAKSKLVLG